MAAVSVVVLQRRRRATATQMCQTHLPGTPSPSHILPSRSPRLNYTLSDPTTTSTSTAPDSTTSSSDSEDFTFRGFEGTRYEGRASDLLRGQGSFGLGFNASSYVWEPSGTPCCATLCRRSTWVGWWCQSRRQPDASATFNRVDISCSDDKSEDSSRARCITGFP